MTFHHAIHSNYQSVRPAPAAQPTTVTTFNPDLANEVATMKLQLFWTQIIAATGICFCLGLLGVLLYAQHSYISRSLPTQSFQSIVQQYRG